jgi:hypothetical protein
MLHQVSAKLTNQPVENQYKLIEKFDPQPVARADQIVLLLASLLPHRNLREPQNL